MRYTGIQPQYFPRLHYFARILMTDIFVLRDDAQFVSKHQYPNGQNDKSYQADTPIKLSNGRSFLHVPIAHQGRLPLAQSKISYDHPWIENHLKTLQFAYARAPHFSDIFPEIQSLLCCRFTLLSDLNFASIGWTLRRILGFPPVHPEAITLNNVNTMLKNSDTSIRLQNIQLASKSSALSSHPNLSANEKILLLMHEACANEDYCGGTGVAAYLDHTLFKKAGITVTVQDWTCKQYEQQFTGKLGFIPNLSIIDLLMNVSTEKAREILLGKK